MRTSIRDRKKGWLLACDPGLRAVGVALFYDGALVRAGAVRGPEEGRGPGVWFALAAGVYEWVDVPPSGLAGPCTLVVETMRHNPSRSVPVEDLLELAGVAGAIVGRLGSDCWEAHAALAHRWKGQVKRHVMGARVERHLHEEGTWSRVEVPSRATELNDAMHAIGLGRWWLGV